MKMERAGGRAELGTISMAVWEGGLGTVGGTRVKEGLRTNPGPGGRGYRGKCPGCLMGRNRHYN
jgi:hypothetical protein